MDLSTGDAIEEAPGYDTSGRYDVAPEVPVPAGVWALPPSATETPLHTVVQGDRALLVVRAAASSIGAELGPMAPRAIVLDGDHWRPVDACPGDVATVFTTPDQLWLGWAEGSRVQWAPVTPCPRRGGVVSCGRAPGVCSAAMALDHRAVPTSVLNLYLYPVGAWALALAGLYFTGRGPLAIPLCYPLACWQIALSAWWGRSLIGRLGTGELTNLEAHAGVRSIGQILAWSALCPAMVFMTNDPLAPSAWSAALGAVAVSGATYLGVMALTRPASRWTHGAAIALGCVALPLNATGAVTIASMLGLFDRVLAATPTP